MDDVEYDIANLDYDELPERYKHENREAARVACESVKAVMGSSKSARAIKDNLNDEFINKAADAQHVAWIERNRETADPSLLVPYDELPEDEKEKDRLIVREAIRLYRLWCIRSPSHVQAWPGIGAAQ